MGRIPQILDSQNASSDQAAVSAPADAPGRSKAPGAAPREGDSSTRRVNLTKEAINSATLEPTIYAVDLDEAHVDADAAKVVRRLVRHGYEAYLVGGGVRDLLIGKAPKDFDVATSAR